MIALQQPSTDAVNTALLVLRLAAGGVMIAHGYNHIFRGGKIEGTARWFASVGMKPGILHAWLASIAELGAGALLFVGLLTPLAAAAVASVMLVAIATVHRKNGFFIFRPGEGWEYTGFITLTALALGTLGAGEWSLDDAFEITAFNGWTSFWVTALVGLGSAAALLAVFYRPDKSASS